MCMCVCVCVRVCVFLYVCVSVYMLFCVCWWLATFFHLPSVQLPMCSLSLVCCPLYCKTAFLCFERTRIHTHKHTHSHTHTLTHSHTHIHTHTQTHIQVRTELTLTPLPSDAGADITFDYPNTPVGFAGASIGPIPLMSGL